MNPQVEPVVREANENRQKFEALCRALSPEELASVVPGGTWRVQDYIAHLASIDIYVGDWFEHQAEGKRWRPSTADGGPFNIDTWNESRIGERREMTLDALFGEAARHREQLWNAVGRFSDEILAEQFNFRGRDVSFLRYLQMWVAHDPAHYADMLRGLPAEKRDEDTGAWLARYSL